MWQVWPQRRQKNSPVPLTWWETEVSFKRSERLRRAWENAPAVVRMTSPQTAAPSSIWEEEEGVKEWESAHTYTHTHTHTHTHTPGKAVKRTRTQANPNIYELCERLRREELQLLKAPVKRSDAFSPHACAEERPRFAADAALISCFLPIWDIIGWRAVHMLSQREI